MTYAKGVVGYAVYVELRKTVHTQQMLLLPSFVDPATKNVIPPNLLARLISEGNEKRGWRFRDIQDTGIELDPQTNQLKQLKDVNESFNAIAPVIETANKYIHSAINTNDFKLAGEPLVVELTRADAKRLQMVKTPEALLRRMMSARADRGYPKNLVTTTDELKERAQKAATSK